MTNRTKKVDWNKKCSVCGRNLQSNNTSGMCSNCQQLGNPALKFYKQSNVSDDELSMIIKRYKIHLVSVREDRRKKNGRDKSNRM